MNTNVKLVIGGLVGAGIGYFVGSVIVDIIDLKEHPDTDDYNDIEYPNTQDGGPEIDETEGKELFQRLKTMPKRTVRNYAQAFKENPALQKLVEKYNGELEGDTVVEDSLDITEEITDFGDDITAEEDDNPLISIISMADFANAEGYETVTLNYYDDDVVTDEHDVPIDHPEQILGEDALVSFGEMSEDADVVYVRNEPKRAMYEVVRTNKNYQVQKARRARKEAILRNKSVITNEEDHDGEDND